MPSKVMIQVANDFDRRRKFSAFGVEGGESLKIDYSRVMEHVRSLRDRFVRSVLSPMDEWEDKFIKGRAEFVDAHTLRVNDEEISAERIIIAVGSRPIIPKDWQSYSEHLVDTDSFFEMKALPSRMAVIGLGVIGIELGQALKRLGVDVIGITLGNDIGGLSDPKIREYVTRKFSEEMPIHINGAEVLGLSDKGLLRIKADDKIYEVPKALIAVGRRPNLDRVNIEKLGHVLNDRGVPAKNPNTMQLEGFPHIFIAGDATFDRPILHEASDEGFIAGHNAVNAVEVFQRRLPLGITFSDPNIAYVGKRFEQLKNENAKFVIGEVSFEGQGRSIVKLKEQGLLRLYAEENSGKILGAEIHAPDGEHLAHLLAWGISAEFTVKDALRMPFYHPVIEEGLKTALRDAAEKLYGERPHELWTEGRLSN